MNDNQYPNVFETTVRSGYVDVKMEGVNPDANYLSLSINPHKNRIYIHVSGLYSKKMKLVQTSANAFEIVLEDDK